MINRQNKIESLLQSISNSLHELSITQLIIAVSTGPAPAWFTSSDINIGIGVTQIATNRSKNVMVVAATVLNTVGAANIGFGLDQGISTVRGIFTPHTIGNRVVVALKPGDTLYARATAAGSLTVELTPITTNMLSQFYPQKG